METLKYYSMFVVAISMIISIIKSQNNFKLMFIEFAVWFPILVYVCLR